MKRLVSIEHERYFVDRGTAKWLNRYVFYVVASHIV